MSDTGILVSLSNEDAFRSRVVLDYTSRDFTAIRAQLVGLAKGLMPEWETAGETPDFGTLLLELFAYMGDVMHFYIDRTASEAFLGTAVRRQSILYIADMLGYRPIGQQAASVELLFSLDSNAEVAVTLPQHIRVYNETDNSQSLVIFETDQELTLNPGDTDIPVTATEGVVNDDTLLGVSIGVPNSEFLIREKGVVFNTVSIRTVEGGQTLPWTFVTDLSLARPTQAVFTTFLDDNDMTHVVFGDNAAGRIPPVNAQLYVTYRFGVGARANDVPAEKINTISAATAPNVDLWGVSVRNPSSPVGGTDPEAVDAMRFSIPRASSRIKSRAITLNDYADLAMQVPGVAKSVAHGTIYTAVHVTIAPQKGQGDANYMHRLCLEVEDYMKDKIIVGSTVYAEPEDVNALWIDIYIRVQIHVVEGYNRTNVRLQVESVIRQILAFDRVDFGWRVSIGRIYRAALAIQGVEWAEVLWLSTDAPPEAFAPVTGASPQVTTFLLTEAWKYNTSTTMTDPGATFFRTNVTDSNITSMVVSTLDHDNEDAAARLATVKIGDQILLRQTDDPDSQIMLVITAAPVNNTTWFQFTVAKIESPKWSTTTNNERVILTFIRQQATVSTGEVIDIDTDPLLIPRIEPTEVTEEETNYPTGWTEEERIHDGLWVWAVGGVPGT